MSTSTCFLRLEGITKRFSGVTALDRVDLTLHQGEILALLGENGAGKSTLMKILSGVYPKDAGTITFDGQPVEFSGPRDAQSRGISIIYQEFSLVPWLNVVENLFLGREEKTRIGRCDTASMQAKARAILDRLGVDIDLKTPVARLSVAEQQFVEIAKALLRETRILILDEPTATLTPQEAKKLFAVMRDLKAAGVAMIFISHHLDEIFEIADRIACLRDGKSVGERTADGATVKDLVNLIVGRDVTHAFPVRPADHRPGDVILDVRKLQLKAGAPELRFTLRKGEILGVAGLVGSGRTEMARALIGADLAHAHDVVFEGRPLRTRRPYDARRAGISLLPEDRKHQGLILSNSLIYNITLANLRNAAIGMFHWLSATKCRDIALSFIETVRIKTSSPHQLARELSGGNQQKVVIAKWLNAGCNVMIFDEPTRGIDVGGKSEIYKLMRQLSDRGVSIIMISSELPEVVGMSDRVIVMRNQRIEHIFESPADISEQSIMLYATGGHHV
ncbi:ABC-type sugar transport system, ATPase component [Opitutaceae bacterium TAV1]|nr:ABC-type sugar transport system, ATPase component [Opitutaceae bacterium TAV1]